LEETKLSLYLASMPEMAVIGAQEEAAATKEEEGGGVLEGVPLGEVAAEVARQEVQGSEGTAEAQEGVVVEGVEAMRRAQIRRGIGRGKKRINHAGGRGVMIAKWREVESRHEETHKVFLSCSMTVGCLDAITCFYKRSFTRVV
jgi:hypothetical protein